MQAFEISNNIRTRCIYPCYFLASSVWGPQPNTIQTSAKYYTYMHAEIV